MKIKGAIFDMDGTIIDSLMFWDYLWSEVGKKYMNCEDFRPSEELDRSVRTMIFVDAMAYFKEYYKLDVDTDELVRFASDGLSAFYRDVARSKAGAPELLEHLRSQGIKMCLASATASAEIKGALESHGMLGYFDNVLSCADIGVGKDKPDIYLKALDSLGLPREEVCVFEDSFVALETAKKAGFRTVGVYEKYNFNQERVKAASDIYLDGHGTLADLIPMIEA